MTESILFLGFVYVVVITLASRMFEYFLRFLLLACVSCAFWLRWGFPLCVTPYFLAYPHVFLPCGPFSGVFRLYLAFIATTVVLAPIATPITAPFLLLAFAVRLFWCFSSEFRDFRASFGLSWNILFVPTEYLPAE